MLEKLREGSQGIVAKVILGLVILSFALAGVGSYIASPSTPLAAEVNGEEITRSDFDTAYQNERASRENQYGDAFNQMAANPQYMAQMRQEVLDKLVADRLVDQAVERYGLRASAEQIKQAIRSSSFFQTDGQFDNERYLSLLSRSRLAPAQYAEMVRTDLNRRQLQIAIQGSEFALSSEAELLAKLELQTRDMRSVTVPLSAFMSEDAPSDAAQQAYYDENLSLFQTEEAVDLEYIVVDTATLAASISIEDSAAEEYYQQNMARYTSTEQRKVAHILFAKDDPESATKAEQVLAELKTGADFAELAKQYSIDTFSAENGGELDWFERDVYGEAFDEVAFALDIGESSDIIEGEYGLQIIKLLDIQAGQELPFAEVKDKVLSKLKQQQAEENFYAKAQQLSEVAFEIPDGLEEVASETGLNLQAVDKFTRSSAAGDLAEQSVLTQVFNPAFIAEGVNSDAINLSDNKTLVVRVNQHYPADAKPFTEVQASVIYALQQQQAADAAQAYADELVVALANQQEVDSLLASHNLALSESVTVSRNDRSLEPQVIRHLFSMAKQAGASQVMSMNGDYIVLELEAVNDSADVDATAVQRWEQQLESMKSYSSYQLLLDVLKSQADISYLL